MILNQVQLLSCLTLLHHMRKPCQNELTSPTSLHTPAIRRYLTMKQIPDAQKDYFGGIAAKQHIICALGQGPEEHYAMCEQIARDFYRPVMRSHRCTIEQMAILEPALSESVGATFAKVLKDATDEAARRGVPYQAAEDFLLGHLTILLAVAFGIQPGGKLSDGCLLAISEAEPVIFKDGWLDKVFAPEAVKASVRSICK